MRYQFYTADVFTDHVFGGNQLAVFPDAAGLDGEQMQQIAREFNLSETVFVLPPERPEHTRRLRIFTPGAELPFAGHPTVGTAVVLAAIGALPSEQPQTDIVFEELVGPVPVTIQAEAGRPTFARLTAAQLPVFGPAVPPASDLAAVLSLGPGDLAGGDDTPQAVSCGTPFLFVPLRDRATVDRARLDLARWEATLAHYWAPQVFLFARGGSQPGADIYARMFAPVMGIVEDPATGAAAAALAGYLAARETQRDGTLRWVVEQGVAMGRPSILEVEADLAGSAVTAVRVGGYAVMVSEGTMNVP